MVRIEEIGRALSDIQSFQEYRLAQRSAVKPITPTQENESCLTQGQDRNFSSADKGNRSFFEEIEALLLLIMLLFLQKSSAQVVLIKRIGAPKEVGSQLQAEIFSQLPSL